MAEQTSTSSQSNSAPAPAPRAASNDVSYAPQNTMRDIAATISTAAKEAHKSNALRDVKHAQPIDRDMAEVVEKVSEENPIRKQLKTQIKDDSEALHVVDSVLKKLFSGAKLMHMPPDSIHAIVSAIYAHVADYQTHKEQNPNLDIGYLHMKIDTGSHFFHSAHQSILEHHPEHENYLDGVDGSQDGHDNPHNKAKKARLRHSHARPVEPQEHVQYGYPTGRAAHDAVPAAAVVVSPEKTLSAGDVAEHIQDIHDDKIGGEPGTVVGDVREHSMIEFALHTLGLH